MTQQTGRRPDASMSLLTNLITHGLDEGYAEAAARREAQGEPAGHRRGSLLLLVGVLAVAVVLTVAAVQTRDRLPAGEKERASLVAQVQQRGDSADKLQARIDQLRAQVATARRDRLTVTSTGRELAARLGRLELVTGADPVVGPGLRVTVDDAKTAAGTANGDPRADGGIADGTVRDRDLQQVVNGLWASGAEAIAINGHRLTNLTSIRAAGQAILVDFRPLVPPYRIEAVGDSARLQARFAASAGGAYLQALATNYDVRYDVTRVDRLDLPASSTFVLRSATPVEESQ